jgi:hypothetical protein
VVVHAVHSVTTVMTEVREREKIPTSPRRSGCPSRLE